MKAVSTNFISELRRTVVMETVMTQTHMMLRFTIEVLPVYS